MKVSTTVLTAFIVPFLTVATAVFKVELAVVVVVVFVVVLFCADAAAMRRAATKVFII